MNMSDDDGQRCDHITNTAAASAAKSNVNKKSL